MRLTTIAMTVAALTIGSAAFAETTIVREETAPTVTIEKPAVTIERRDPAVTIERRSVETTGVTDCRTKTVTKEDAVGSTTVKKEKCD